MLILFGISLGFLQSISEFLPFESNLIGLGFLILYSVIFSIIASIIFFKKHFDKPLNLLVNSSKKIADNNLDFKITYPINDEMGLLCDAIKKCVMHYMKIM